MPSFRFLHAADLHLDTPFSGIGRSAPEVQRALRDASLEAWDGLVRAAIERDVAFVVLAGDLYDGADRGLRAQVRVLAGLRRLSDAGIEVLVVHGNHDPLDGRQAIDTWPEHVRVCPAGEVTSHEIVRGGVRLATVHGVSYATARESSNLARRFPVADGGGFHVGVLHCSVGAHPEHGTYAPCTLDDLRGRGHGYWALGHVHGHRVLARDPWIVYSGGLQGRSPKPAESGAKGAVIVEVEGDQVERVEHVALDRVRFATVAVELGSAASTGPAGPVDGGGVLGGVGAGPDRGAPGDLVALVAHLGAVGREASAAADGRSVVLRARLTGRTRLHRELARPGAVGELLEELRAGGRLDPPFLWWGSLVDETTPAIDREALRAQGDLRGALVARVDRLAEAEGLTIDRPGGWFERLERELEREGVVRDAGAELRAAEALALDLLVGEEVRA